MDLAVPHGFYFGPVQDLPGLDRVVNLIVVPGFPVPGQHTVLRVFLAFMFRLLGHRPYRVRSIQGPVNPRSRLCGRFMDPTRHPCVGFGMFGLSR